MKMTLKKTLALLSSVLTAGTLVLSSLPASAAELRNGDANGDGKVNIYDAIEISKHVMKKTQLTGTNLKQADYNKDGNVNIYDAVFISRLILCEKNINEVVGLINLKRITSGKQALVIDQNIVDASMKRASELPKKFSGDYRPDKSRFETIFAEYDVEYQVCANCVAAVPATPKELFDEMMKRSDIKERLLNSDYTKIGVGYCGCNDQYKNYWAILLV